MSNYYWLTWDDRPKYLSSAFAPENIGADHGLIPMLEGKNSIPFDFELRKVSETKNGIIISKDLAGLNPLWLDYQPNSMLWPLMSPRLKTLVERNLKGDEGVDWLSCKITDGKETKIYFILRFNKKPDVLDPGKTMFIKNTDVIIKPVFSLAKINGYNIFTKPLSDDLWRITSSVYISEALKKQIEKEKLTGAIFETAVVA